MKHRVSPPCQYRNSRSLFRDEVRRGNSRTRQHHASLFDQHRSKKQQQKDMLNLMRIVRQKSLPFYRRQFHCDCDCDDDEQRTAPTTAANTTQHQR